MVSEVAWANVREFRGAGAENSREWSEKEGGSRRIGTTLTRGGSMQRPFKMPKGSIGEHK